MDADWRTERRAGVTLVAVTLANRSNTRKRATLATRLDGAVWPPRRRGVPEERWDDGRVVVTVPGGTSRGIGFASPEPPSDPPVAVTDIEQVGDENETTGIPGGDVTATPEGVARALVSPAPPRDAVPGGDAATRNGGRKRNGDREPREPEIPPAVAAWLDRIERAAASGESVPAATLRAVARRTSRLADGER